jgi:GWxTD domain-containing protein
MRLHLWAPVVAALLLLGAAPAPAEDLSKQDKEWLESVEPILLPDEREAFERLRKQDREEFRDIFWARRDPAQEQVSPDNAFRKQYQGRVEEADRRFRVLGRKGSRTDCGFVFLLLGEPADVTKGTPGIDPGVRVPETWVYRGEEFTGGETSVSFDESCELPRPGGARFKEQLAQLARSFVTRPGIDYELAADGELVSLADQLPKPSPATALMDAPRQDFAFEAETKLMMRGQDGSTYVAGLVRGDASELSVRESDGQRLVDLMIAAEAIAGDGSVPQSGTIEIEARVDDQGRFVASWPLSVPPGLYTLRLGAVDPQGGKGSTTNLIFEAPDFSGASGIGISQPVVFAEMRQGVTAAPKDAMGALTLGNNQLLPPFGNVFAPEDALQVLVFVYGAQTDPNGAGSIGTTFEIRRGGETVSRSQEQVFETPQAVAAVGPVPLASFGPGEYSVLVKIEDKLAAETHERTASFTIAVPPQAEEPTADPQP